MSRRLSGTAGLLLAVWPGGLAPAPAGAEGAGGIRFREVADAWGLDFRHHHGGSGERYMVETMVGGLVLLDFDGDGDEDVFFVDGGPLPGYEGEPATSRLYRNEGGGRFVDRTARSGIDFEGYGCGGTAGDWDGDGDVDLYVTAFGPNVLYRNRGDGTFAEVQGAAGAADPLWSAAAGFSDVDLDGDLDLYVANYVDFTLATHKFCGNEEAGIQGYCQPDAYPGEPDRLYVNREGRFEDVTAAAGLEGAIGPGLGIVFGDVDLDGWPDLYVANDQEGNFLFRNRGDGSFEDLSLISGTSHSDRGKPEAGMGVDLGDVDGDGLDDLVVTNFELETNGLYRNSGGGLFRDQRFQSGIAEPSLLNLAFGVAFADLDHDADLDLAVANGHVQDNAELFTEGGLYAQRNQIFENLGGGRFREIADHGMDEVRVSRGLAHGDLDGDGDLDLVISNSNDRAEVYENVSDTAGRGWLKVSLRGADRNRFGIGARLELAAGGIRQVREVRTTSSYASQNALPAHFGLAGAAPPIRFQVRWPRGRRQLLTAVPPSRHLVLYE